MSASTNEKSVVVVAEKVVNPQKPIYKSTKFWAAVSGVAAVALAQFFGVPEATTMQVAGIIISFILGRGLADINK